MSLRTRLIIAFLCLSVVPLSAVTAFWYASSVSAFERAAEREAAQTAVEIGKRMENVTRAVGRRMDRLFDAASADGRRLDPDAPIHDRVTPLLGDAAALIDRVEIEPMEGMVPLSTGGKEAPLTVHRVPTPPRAPGPKPPAHVPPPAPAAPPPPPRTIVVDVPKIMAEASKRAKAGGAAQGVDLGPLLDTVLAATGPAVEAGLAIAAESIAKQAEAAASAERLQMDVKGRQIEVALKRDGRVVGKANATLNLDKTMPTVLALARRDQGEIPFAVDTRGKFYTPDPGQRQVLTDLGVIDAAKAAAGGKPRRIGDWIVVARTEPSGLIFGIARPIGESLHEIRRMSWRNLSMGLAVIALACIGIIPISHRMTQHVSSLNAGVRQLAAGDFKARVPVRSSDEFGELAAAFNRMAGDLERHQALVIEQERLHRELELSRLIQTEMLPREPLRLGAAEIKGVSIPAREVGGDFFNYFALPDGRLALLVGDVSGKGVSAALLMANVQATLRARLPLETELARLADGLDNEIDANTPRGVYLTLFLGILDVQRGVLTYVNAGHNPQFVLRLRGGINPLTSTGLPIALLPGKGYKESSIEIAPGDLLFFYTDGLVETENVQGEMFGPERLQALLAEEHEHGIDTVLQRIESAVGQFRGKAEPFDDATMMALRINS
jgi:serine phosphatase RsbU (regulator of sigma subunit)